jgi:UDP-2,3-diacylglucosamine hydrolase
LHSVCIKYLALLKEIAVLPNKKIYFASDFHLGAPNLAKSQEREKVICTWLDSILPDAQVVFLVGDLFDFWFSYKYSIPKGFTRFFGKLAQLHDAGIEIYIFTGNHDMWMDDYFSHEFGAKIFRNPQSFLLNKQSFLVGHGDGLGPGDYGYKVLKRIFENPVSRFLFGRCLHPNLGLGLGFWWANSSWRNHEKENDVYVFEDKEKEILFKYCQKIEEEKHYDFYIFGHRHFMFDLKVSHNSRYINLGDWIKFNSFASFDGTTVSVLKW